MKCYCKNCKHVDKQRQAVLRAKSEANAKGVPVHWRVVFELNETLKNFPCIRHENYNA